MKKCVQSPPFVEPRIRTILMAQRVLVGSTNLLVLFVAPRVAVGVHEKSRRFFGVWATDHHSPHSATTSERMTIRSEEVRAIAAFCRASYPHHSNGSAVFRDKRDGYLVFQIKKRE